MSEFFKFEADFVDTLRCIPMQVRFKLDTCGIKLKLSDWNHFSSTERQVLVEQPCTTKTEIQEYREVLQQLVKKYSGTPADELPVEPYPDWMDVAIIQHSIKEKDEEIGVTLTTQRWIDRNPLRALCLN